MLEYLVLFCVLLFGSLFYSDKRIDKNNEYLILEYILIVIIFGLRYKVGGDTLNYYSEFQYWPTLEELPDYDTSRTRYNIGWTIFTAVCKSICNNFAFMQVVHAMIVNGAFFYFFKKNVKKYFTAILIYAIMYIFTFNTEILRAALAVSVFLYGYSIFQKKKWLKYYLLCILAFSFHSEAIIMFMLPLCYPLARIKPSMINLLIFIAISMITVVVLDIVPYLLSVFTVSEKISQTFAYYADMSFKANINAYLGLTLFMIPWLFFLWLTRKERMVLWRGFILLFIFFSYQQLRYLEFMVRACDFLYPFTVVAIVDSLSRTQHMKDKVMRWLVIVSVMITLGHRTYEVFGNKHWKLFYPYTSILNPEENPDRKNAVRQFQLIQ